MWLLLAAPGAVLHRRAPGAGQQLGGTKLPLAVPLPRPAAGRALPTPPNLLVVKEHRRCQRCAELAAHGVQRGWQGCSAAAELAAPGVRTEKWDSKLHRLGAVGMLQEQLGCSRSRCDAPGAVGAFRGSVGCLLHLLQLLRVVNGCVPVPVAATTAAGSSR